MSADINIQIQIMQDNLCDLRKIAGWTAEILAGKLGITKQTISNLENQKVKLSRIQYIAIRAIFECEIATNTENTTLRKVMNILFVAMPPVYDSNKGKIRTAMISISSIAAAGLSGIQLYSSATSLLAPLGRAAICRNNARTDEPTLRWLLEELRCEVSEVIQNDEFSEEEIDENS